MRKLVMNSRNVIQLGLLLLLFGLFNYSVKAENSKIAGDLRQRLSFNEDWIFQLGDISGAEKATFNDASWRHVKLPHDWSIEGEFDENAPSEGVGGYLPTGIAWYRKHFVLPETSQNIWIEFGGIYMNSEVWINDHYAGKNVYGYTSFYYDITPYIKSGENVIAVKVDNSIQPNSRWYSGSGIYRNVWLNVANPVHISQWGTYITTPVIKDTLATVSLNTTIANTSPTTSNAVLSSRILDKNGKVVVSLEDKVAILAGKQHEYRQELDVPHPLLWSVENPALYTLHSVIKVNDKIIDRVDTRFGIRALEYSAEKGFLLNGKRVKMNGVNLHEDAGCLGAAVPIQVWERRLKTLKEMGCNAIRTSHNPRSSEFMDLCDELGFLVMNELFDEWTFSKGQTTSAYHVYFKDNWEKDAANFIRRDRNHPSVVLWSAGNEVRDQLYPEGVEVLRKLLNLFHTEDPTRPVTQGNDQIAGEAPWPALPEFLDRLDIVGYNYVGRWRDRAELYYTVDKIAHPNWKMIGTENGAAYSDRNFSLGTDKNTVNPNYTTGMLEAEALWKYTAVHDFVIGDFMWTGIDYLGESRWPSRGSGGSPMDMAGFTKSNYYFYQSLWTEKPMVHILPHWNWKGREGQVIPVLVYSNCDAVELFVNGKSFGEQRLNFPRYGMAGGWGKRDRPFVMATTNELHLSWTVPYQPGEVKAVGKIQGKVVFTETIQTTDKPAALRVTSDKKTIRPNGEDIAHIKVEIVDSKGNLVPTANNEIRFSVKGEGQLIGAESGDNRSHNSGHFKNLDSSQVAAKEAYCGLILGYVQAAEKAGNITVEVSSQGLKGAVVNLSSR